MTRQTFTSRAGAVLAAAILSVAGIAHADTVTIDGIAKQNVKVNGITAGELMFTSSDGTQGQATLTPDMDKVSLSDTDDPALNDADASFAHAVHLEQVLSRIAAPTPEMKQQTANEYANAGAGFEKVFHAAAKPWEKDYALRKLLVAGQKSNHFDLAITAWIGLLQTNPDAAAKNKPALPTNANSKFVTDAIAALDSAAGSSTNGDARKQLLLYEHELLKAQNTAASQSADAKIMQELIELGGGDPAIVLSQVRQDLDANNLQSAQTRIGAIKTLPEDPATKAEYYYDTADINRLILNNTTNPPETAYEDAALKYMQCFALDPHGAHAADCLLKIAELHEKFDPKEAVALYREVTRDYPATSGAVKQAKASLDRLSQASGG